MIKHLYSIAVLLGLLVSCARKQEAVVGFSPQDKNEIKRIINIYNTAWLQDDSTAILNLFTDSAILIPSGMAPIVGKRQISKFWWPNDSSVTKINKYEIDLLEVSGTHNLAYTYENGRLSWSYEKGDFKMSQYQEAYEITIFKKDGSGWKIIKRIWSDYKVEKL